jgi:hypothetical protein
MSELIDLLRAQLDEDERVARAADVKQGDPDWRVSPVAITAGEHFTVRSVRDSRPIARVQRLDGDDDEPAAILDGAATAEHIARWDPARVLAEVDAKRRILDEHAPDRQGYCPTCNDNTVEAPCHTVRLLALPMADRPGYLEEWRA